MLKTIINALAHTHTRLIAVSKTKPVESILQMYEQGQRDFGENKVQELVEKYEKLPQDIRWHLIGHLQTNKVKYIASFVHLIHSIDSLDLLQEIDKQAKKYNRTIDCLLQIKIAAEDTKFGMDKKDAALLLSFLKEKQLQYIRIVGIMGMATFTDNQDQIRREFRQLKMIFDDFKNTFFAQDPNFKEISMGMSDDYKIALEEGSTMIRIGSLIFGTR